MILELEVIDQLLSGRMKLQVLRQLFDSDEHFQKAILGLVACGDIVLLRENGDQLQEWDCRALFEDRGLKSEANAVFADATEEGAKKIA